MKCEICHQADAEAAIVRGEGEAAEELYVCKACAKAERQRRQKKSQRTRKVTGLPPGVSMSITRIEPATDGDSNAAGEDDGEELPEILGSFLDAMNGMVSDLEKAAKGSAKKKAKKADAAAEEPKLQPFPLSRVEAPFRVRDRIHLEGLHLIGEIEAVRRALHALDMDLVGVEADGVHETGHVYSILYAGSSERAKRVVEDILREERNARVRLADEMPRVFGDSLCRALAILKNCRLLSPAELFDLLSPMRLAAMQKFLDGITLADVESLMLSCDLSGADDTLEPEARDRADAERADDMNRRFEDVMLNERAEEKFL